MAGAPGTLEAQARAALGAGRLHEARDLLNQAAETGGASADGLHILGELLYHFKDMAGAETRLRQALDARPGFTQAAFALGMLLNRADRPADAVAVLSTAAREAPGHEGILFNLAEALNRQDEAAEAARLYRRVIEINPRNGRAHNNLGTRLEQDGVNGEALACYQRAAEAEPTLVPAWRNLARLAEVEQKTDLADAAHRALLTREGLTVDAACGYGRFLARNGRPGDAEALLRRAIEAAPGEARLHAALSQALGRRGLLEEAVEAAQRATELDPDRAEGWLWLGRAYNSMNRSAEAADALLKAVHLDASSPAHVGEAARTLRGAKRMAEALEYALRAALPEDFDVDRARTVVDAVLATGEVPDEVVAAVSRLADQRAQALPLTGLATFFGALGRHRSVRRLFDALDAETRSSSVAWSGYAFNANYDPDITAEDLFAHYQRYADVLDLPDVDAAPLPTPALAERRKLRVGYVSPDFRTHSVINFILPILENHDRDAFEIHAYAELKVGDSQTRVVQDLVDGWRLTTHVSDEDVAAAIRGDGIDVLVDLAGHTAGHRLGMFRHRPAPATATWLGYLYTTAAPGVDYFIGDTITSPPEAAHLFSETLVRLPHYSCCFRPSEKAPETITPAPAVTNGYVTFGNCSRPVRVNDAVLNTWAEILTRAPTARLRLDHPDYSDPWSAEFMRNRMAEAGLPLDRVYVGHSGEYWGFYSTVDVVLDTFPHASGTTTCEALYMGVPVLAAADRPSVGRMGAAMVDSAGHPEWIGWNTLDYIHKAVRMTRDIDTLRTLRGTLRDALLASPMCDAPRFVRNLEEAYRMMARNARDGVRRPLEVPDVSRRASTATRVRPALAQ